MKNRQNASINTGSMADIAFLILIFFLTTTTIATEKGLAMRLPPPKDDQPQLQLHERDVLNLLINSQDEIMGDGQVVPLEDVAQLVKGFVNNNGAQADWSTSPFRAVVSLKADRGTSYERYISLLDQIKLGYHQLRAQHLGISVDAYNSLDRRNPKERAQIEEARHAFPMQLSEADPSSTDAS